jgi:hypothetical protein
MQIKKNLKWLQKPFDLKEITCSFLKLWLLGVEYFVLIVVIFDIIFNGTIKCK